LASGIFSFTAAGGMVANNIARWNGSNWSAIGSGRNTTARVMAPLPDGNIGIGGDFLVAGGDF
jgi:hypothetical protein